MKQSLFALFRHSYTQALLKYGLGFLLLGYVLVTFWDQRQEDGQQVGLSAVLERQVSWTALILATAVTAVSLLVTVVRWHLLVRAQDLPFAMRDAVRLCLLGFFFNTCLPGSVGGDLIKAAFLAREQSRRALAVATVVLDRVLGFVGLYWLTTLLGGSLFLAGALETGDDRARWTLEAILLASLGIAAASLVFWVVLGLLPGPRLDRIEERLRAVRRVGSPLAELIRAVRIYRSKGRHVAVGLGLALVGHFGFVLGYYGAARFFTPAEQLPSLGAHLLLVPIGMTIQAGIPLPGGIGGTEAAFGALYRLAGYPFADGVLTSLAQRVIMAALGFVSYLIYLRMPGPASPVIEAVPPAPAQ